ncbi:MAG TPA: gliding motility lipoprotein GldD [Bacteroidales bacterium]|nr:MAG: gliding motility lipoprotein GldD [Bacteroidetes bacterium GWF2_33_38]OFY75288.1 MAG: gliding motility lipoprotein GldD [Bacteroidetes bacterium RIFOXYA12_FULL_33_9]HBF87813.1 gliding motility lipoprotein GldD [Bacteroidales bacterium]
MRNLIPILFSIALFSSCEESFVPKPKGYFRIDFPEKEYEKFDLQYPYSFEYSNQSLIYEYNKDSFWVNIFYPYYKATVYITYKDVHSNVAELMEQSRKYAYKHTAKADAIGETLWLNDTNRVYGLLYDIKGNAASPINFFLTDSSKHFMSGALYFNVKPNKDSLAPVVAYLREDILRLIESLNWNK